MGYLRRFQPTDWDILRQRAVAVGRPDLSRVCSRVVTELLGENLPKSAVDLYVNYVPQAELARMVLEVARPEAARRRCLEVYESDPSPARRAFAIDLLCDVGDESILPLINSFLVDPHEDIQCAGIAVLDALVWRECVRYEEVQDYLQLADQSGVEYVRMIAARIRDRLREGSSGLEQPRRTLVAEMVSAAPEWPVAPGAVPYLDPSGWETLAARIHADGPCYSHSSGQRAIVDLLGEDFIDSAIQAFLDDPSSALVAGCVLRVLEPEQAIRECRRAFDGENAYRRCRAAEYLAGVRKVMSVSLLERFLTDADSCVQRAGAKALEVGNEMLAAEEIEPYLRLAEKSPEASVRQTASRIRKQWAG